MSNLALWQFIPHFSGYDSAINSNPSYLLVGFGIGAGMSDALRLVDCTLFLLAYSECEEAPRRRRREISS